MDSIHTYAPDHVLLIPPYFLIPILANHIPEYYDILKGEEGVALFSPPCGFE